MTKEQLIDNAQKLTTCLQNRAITPQFCEVKGDCSNCPYEISAIEAAATVGALFKEFQTNDKKRGLFGRKK